jgi:hypothetical protein
MSVEDVLSKKFQDTLLGVTSVAFFIDVNLAVMLV